MFNLWKPSAVATPVRVALLVAIILVTAMSYARPGPTTRGALLAVVIGTVVVMKRAARKQV